MRYSTPKKGFPPPLFPFFLHPLFPFYLSGRGGGNTYRSSTSALASYKYLCPLHLFPPQQGFRLGGEKGEDGMCACLPLYSPHLPVSPSASSGGGGKNPDFGLLLALLLLPRGKRRRAKVGGSGFPKTKKKVCRCRSGFKSLKVHPGFFFAFFQPAKLTDVSSRQLQFSDLVYDYYSELIVVDLEIRARGRRP